MPSSFPYDYVANSVKKGLALLGRLDIRSFAELIDAPLSVAVDIVSKNEKHFDLVQTSIDGGKYITGIRQLQRAVPLDYPTVAAAFAAKHSKVIFPANIDDIAKNFSSRPIKWEKPFGLAVAVFADSNPNGLDAFAKARSTYSEVIASNVVRLGVVHGRGQTPELYIFGSILSEATIARGEIDGYAIFSMERMAGEIDDCEMNRWFVAFNPHFKPGYVGATTELITEKEMQQTLDRAGVPTELRPDTTFGEGIAFAHDKLVNAHEIEIGAPIQASSPAVIQQVAPVNPQPVQPQAVVKTGGRRTLVQLNAARTDMVNKLVAAGVAYDKAQELILKPETFTDAEKAFKLTLNPEPSQQIVPGAEQAIQEKTTAPLPVTDPAAQLASLATTSSVAPVIPPPLATVADLKQDIRANVERETGQPAPVSVQAPVQALPPIVAVPPPFPAFNAPTTMSTPPPVANAPVPALSASAAASLLDGLLGASGQ